MSRENVEIVRRIGETWNESGTRAMTEFLTEDVFYEDDPKWPDHRTARGKQEVIDRFEEFFEAWGEEWDAPIDRVVDGGEGRVVAIFTLRTVGGASGAEQEYRWGYLFELRDGLVFHFRAFLDPDEALAAVGAE
jgi:ketosteroid isomerase-like protein